MLTHLGIKALGKQNILTSPRALSVEIKHMWTHCENNASVTAHDKQDIYAHNYISTSIRLIYVKMRANTLTLIECANVGDSEKLKQNIGPWLIQHILCAFFQEKINVILTFTWFKINFNDFYWKTRFMSLFLMKIWRYFKFNIEYKAKSDTIRTRLSWHIYACM